MLGASTNGRLLTYANPRATTMVCGVSYMRRPSRCRGLKDSRLLLNSPKDENKDEALLFRSTVHHMRVYMESPYTEVQWIIDRLPAICGFLYHVIDVDSPRRPPN